MVEAGGCGLRRVENVGAFLFFALPGLSLAVPPASLDAPRPPLCPPHPRLARGSVIYVVLPAGMKNENGGWWPIVPPLKWARNQTRNCTEGRVATPPLSLQTHCSPNRIELDHLSLPHGAACGHMHSARRYTVLVLENRVLHNDTNTKHTR